MHRRHPPAVRRLVEPLDPRRLLAATLAGSTLSIAGTNVADRILVYAQDGDLVVFTGDSGAGTTQRFAAAGVARIDAALGGGDDLFQVQVETVTTPVSVRGEDGNDTLVGGRGDDTLDGGRNNDTVSYLGGETPIAAALIVTYANGATFGTTDIALTGTGGIAGEADRYVDVETIVGSGGRDTLSLTADDSAATFSFSPILVSMLGGGGDDTFHVAHLSNGSNASGLIADGAAGDDAFDFEGPDAGDLLGGDGDDAFANDSDDSSATIEAGAGVDVFNYSNQPGIDYAMPGELENLNASGGAISIAGNDLDNAIVVVAGGTTTVDGAGGNDTITYGATNRAAATLAGGAGDDVIVDDGATLASIVAGPGHDRLQVTRAGSDAAALDYTMPDDLEDIFVSSTAAAKVTGNGGANRIEVQSTSGIVYAGAGDDSVYGGAGDDTLYGQNGRDKIWGRAGDDRIDGGNSNDFLRGEDGDDKVYGRDGNDNVSGGEGADRVYGDAGDDVLNGDGGRDIVYGGAGTDRGARQKADRIFKEIEALL